LLDEPLSNLDAKLREHMRTEIRDLQRRLRITTLYVTHDQVEALSMSNRIAVMANGKIVQEGNAREIYQEPATRFVADFVGSTNFLEAQVLGPGRSEGTMVLRTPAGDLEAVCPSGVTVGEQVVVSLRPENIQIHTEEPVGLPNVLAGTVQRLMFLGEFLDCRVRVGGAEFFTRQHPTTRLRGEQAVWVEVAPQLCAVLSEEHGGSFASTADQPAEPVPA
jgi:iron(III) transport system ATP-binding protein